MRHRRASSAVAPRTRGARAHGSIMAHRGPDGQRTWADEQAGLAFRRLADHRSRRAVDAAACTSGRWHLVFNGEIYNYRELRDELRALGHAFVTEGDGEVLLHAWAEWGEGALDRLDGMFAFAIWNDERRELTLRLRSVRREAALLGAATASGSSSPPTSARCLRPGRTSARRGSDALGPYLGRGLMPPVDESFFAGDAPAAGGAPAAPGRTDASRCDALLAPAAASTSRRATRTRPSGCASCSSTRSACGCAPTSPSARRSAAASTRRRSLRCRRRSPATTAATRSPPASPASRATSGATPTSRSRCAGSSSTTPSSRPPPGSSPTSTRSSPPRRSRSVRRASTRSGVSCAAAREAGVTVLLDGQGADELFGGLPRGERVGAPVRWAARGRCAGSRPRPRPGRRLQSDRLGASCPRSSPGDIAGRR